MSLPNNHSYGLSSHMPKVVFAAYPVWLSTGLILVITAVCWWAFSYSREGYAPQMYGSVRVCCAAPTSLEDFPLDGIQWGDREFFS